MINLKALNTLTKYPSIETVHVMGERGKLTDECRITPGSGWHATEKIDGSNARIVTLNGLQIGNLPLHLETTQIIGSREEWLTCIGDLIANPANRIVEALSRRGRAVRGLWAPNRLTVVYVEVYGAKVGDKGKHYTNADNLGARCFDAWSMPVAEVEKFLAMPLEEIAAWRDQWRQPWLTPSEVGVLLNQIDPPDRIEGVPWLAPGFTFDTPPTVAAMGKLLEAHVERTRAGLGVDGPAEGIVFRNAQTGLRLKARREDYARSTEPPKARGGKGKSR